MWKGWCIRRSASASIGSPGTSGNSGWKSSAPGSPGAQEARLTYRRLKTFGGLSLLEIRSKPAASTRFRLQLARRGWPIVGDQKYGSRRPFAAGIALHARRLAVVHPVRGEVIEIEAPPPKSWSCFRIEP